MNIKKQQTVFQNNPCLDGGWGGTQISYHWEENITMIDSSGWEKRKMENQFPSFCVFVTLSLFFKIVKAFLIFLGIYQMVKTYSLWQKTSRLPAKRRWSIFFSSLSKNSKAMLKTFSNQGFIEVDTAASPEEKHVANMQINGWPLWWWWTWWWWWWWWWKSSTGEHHKDC